VPPIQAQPGANSHANLRSIFAAPAPGGRNELKDHSQSGIVNKSTKMSESHPVRNLASGPGNRGASLPSIGTQQTGEARNYSAHGVSSFYRSNNAVVGMQRGSNVDVVGQQMTLAKSQQNMVTMPKSAVIRNGQAKSTADMRAKTANEQV